MAEDENLEEHSDPSPEDKEPKENLIPESRFNEATGRLKDELKEAQRKLEELQSNQTTETYTRAQLLQAVDEGQITQAQADEYWENQIRQQARDEARQAAQDAQRLSQIQQTVNGYKEVVPGLDDHGHANRAKLQAKYNELVGWGHPNSAVTEIAALEMVFGSLSSLKTKKAGDDLTRKDRDTHQESGGSGEAKDSKDPTKNLDKRKRDHYQKMIDLGQYKDWGEVKKELESYG